MAADIDAEVEAYIASARRRRRMAIRRAERFERMASAEGGVTKPIDDVPPWWAVEDR